MRPLAAQDDAPVPDWKTDIEVAVEHAESRAAAVGAAEAGTAVDTCGEEQVRRHEDAGDGDKDSNLEEEPAGRADDLEQEADLDQCFGGHGEETHSGL